MRRSPLVTLGAVVVGTLLATSGCSNTSSKASVEASSGAAATSTPVTGEAVQPTEQPLAATPPMGWNSWNQVRCKGLNEDVVKRAADSIVSKGLDKVGYRYVVVDDCWQAPARDASGELVANSTTFPHGLEALVDYVHDKGLKFGLYLVPGSKTCAMIWDRYEADGIGSLGHERQDAQMLDRVGVDYLKYDWCRADTNDHLDRVAAFTKMRDELKRLKRPIVYSISEYGQTKPWTWAPDLAHLWRTTGDIAPNWRSIVSIINSQADLAAAAGPGHWNDPDMLQVGNGNLTVEESKTHIGMWAMLAAPLMIGTDIDTLDPDVLAALSNREVIAIDQDSLGKQAVRVRVDGPNATDRTEVWARPLAGGDVAVALLNTTGAATTISATLEEVGAAPGKWKVRDVSNGTDSTPTTDRVASSVPSHGLVILRLSQA